MPDWQRLRGKFIVLDGGEGCGKSTQARRLADFLRDEAGLAVTAARDPGATTIGEKIRALLLDPASAGMSMRCEMLLYMAARAQMMSQVIRPALERGDVVVCDRFVSSTLAYQLGGEGLTREEILAAGEIAVSGADDGEKAGRWPDLTLIFDLPVEIAQQRLKPKFIAPSADTTADTATRTDGAPSPAKDRIEQRPIEYHRQVRENFLAQARDMPERYAVIDAARDPDAVFADVLGCVEARLLE